MLTKKNVFYYHVLIYTCNTFPLGILSSYFSLRANDIDEFCMPELLFNVYLSPSTWTSNKGFISFAFRAADSGKPNANKNHLVNASQWSCLHSPNWTRYSVRFSFLSSWYLPGIETISSSLGLPFNVVFQ